MIKDILSKIAVASACATLGAVTIACAPESVPVDSNQLAADTTSQPDGKDSRGVVLFLGTSLTAGYGVGAQHAYPALIQKKVDSAGYNLRVVNAGISGETSAGGLRRLDWSLQHPVNILVIELGANDGLRGLPIASLRSNLSQIIERTRKRYPDVEIVIAGMEAPPNLGESYTRQFRRTYNDIAREYDAALVPFLLEGVAMVPELNLEDRIHPNATGQKRISETVWKTLEPVIRRVAQSQARAATE